MALREIEIERERERERELLLKNFKMEVDTTYRDYKKFRRRAGFGDDGAGEVSYAPRASATGRTFEISNRKNLSGAVIQAKWPALGIRTSSFFGDFTHLK